MMKRSCTTLDFIYLWIPLRAIFLFFKFNSNLIENVFIKSFVSLNETGQSILKNKNFDSYLFRLKCFVGGNNLDFIL